MYIFEALETAEKMTRPDNAYFSRAEKDDAYYFNYNSMTYEELIAEFSESAHSPDVMLQPSLTRGVAHFKTD